MDMELAERAAPPVRRILSLDALKLLGCVLVVLYHTKYISLAPGGNALPLFYYIRSFMACCVPLFFFVHGYLCVGKPLDPQAHALRMAKIVFLVFFWALISSAVRTLEGEPPVYGIALDALALPIDRTNYLWFLAAIFVLYCFLPFIMELRKSNYRLFLIAATGVLAFCFGVDILRKICVFFSESTWALCVSSFIGRFVPFTENNGFALGYAFLGMIAADSEKGAQNDLSGLCRHGALSAMARGVGKLAGLPFASAVVLTAVLPLVMAVFGLAVSVKAGTEFDVTWNGYGCISTLALVLSLYSVAKRLNACGNTLFRSAIELVGSNSMAVYLLHMLLILPVWRIIPPEGARWYLLLGGIVATCAIVALTSIAGRSMSRVRPLRWFIRL